MGGKDVRYDLERVLVVDDEPAVGSTLLEMLRALGFVADKAGSAHEALEALPRGGYTILISDIRMPGMDGLQLIRRVREDFPSVLCMGVTGYAGEYSYVDVVDAGATDFMQKPVELRELEAKLRRSIIERDLREEIMRLSLTDDLTGLSNRRHFDAMIRQETHRAKRQKHSLGLVLLDLDDFKQHNDRHGHPSGDRVLQKIGGIIRNCIRQDVDSAFRYGGDEMAILLVEADESICRRVVERIRAAVQKELGIGFSFGLVLMDPETTVEGMVEMADQKLYEQKKNRQNG